MTHINKPIIAVDVDDVLADTTEHWRREVNKRAKLNLQPEHWREPGEYGSYYVELWKKHEVDHLISIEDIDTFMHTDQSSMLVMDEAADALNKLEKNYRLIVVTARNPDQKEQTLQWLNAAFPGVFEDIHFTYRDDIKRTKGEICAEIGASWLIDDYPGHCRDAINHGVTAILFGTYGWHIDIPEKAIICKAWKDIERYFDGIRS